MVRVLVIMFVMAVAMFCTSCVTTKAGDIRLVDREICIKGETTITKTSPKSFSASTKCDTKIKLCHLQRLDDEGVWETLVTITTSCDKAPPLNIEGTQEFDFTKGPDKLTGG